MKNRLIIVGDVMSEYTSFNDFLINNEAIIRNFRSMIEDVVIEDDYPDETEYMVAIATGVAVKLTDVETAGQQSDRFYDLVKQLMGFLVLLDLESKGLMMRSKNAEGVTVWEPNEQVISETLLNNESINNSTSVIASTNIPNITRGPAGGFGKRGR